MKILPPVFKRQAGRLRKQRIPFVGEFSSSTRCSNCNSKGHNSRTCKQGKDHWDPCKPPSPSLRKEIKKKKNPSRRHFSPAAAVSRSHSPSRRCNAPNSRGIRELTLKFSGFVAGLFGDSFPFLGVDSIEGHNQVSGKRFPTTGPRIEAGNVVIHRGLHVSHVTASCSLCAIGCKELFSDRHRCPDVLYIVVMLMGYVVDWNCMSMDFKVLRLGKGTARGRPTRGKKDA
ncbi:uncharacterized protein E5676_scaffold592G00030 [Cucumis melo var. makuwa]|uniref:CCHC-type domain-containing protein n=1 Tax=Cucumis melo var. makuwa TaxID=1194695 RepID=A0A5D3DJX0_CUCMM|nr:uncharacterized protein E5676_scaffold592G00030 [Cucumis melo var. makuwa]